MKMLKKVILFLIFFSISIGFVAVGNGYNMYKKAISLMGKSHIEPCDQEGTLK